MKDRQPCKDERTRRPLRVDVQTGVKAWAPRARDIATWAGTAIGRRAAGGELGVRVVGAAESRRLNARYRGKDKPTNVLSFPSCPTPCGLRQAGLRQRLWATW